MVGVPLHGTLKCGASLNGLNKLPSWFFVPIVCKFELAINVGLLPFELT